MKKTVIRLLSVCLMTVMMTGTVLAAPSSDEIAEERKEAEAELEGLESEKSEAEDALSDLEDQLDTIIEKISDLETQLIAKGEEIAETEADIKEAEEIRDKQYDDMKLRIKYMYENGDTEFIEILFSSEDFADMLNKMEYVDEIYSYDRDKLTEYINTVQEIEALKEKLEEEQKELEEQEKEFEDEQAQLDSLISDQENEISGLNEKIESKTAEIAQKKQEEQEAREAEEEARRQAEEEARRQAEAEAQASQTSSGSGTSGQTSYTETSSGGSSSSGTSSGSTSGSSSSAEYVSSGNSSKAQTIVNAAYSQLGVPYVWGGASSSGFDCSGLVMWCHRQAGISLPHSSGSIGSGGKSVSSPQPGDVVCYSGHCGIYIGGGKMIHAPHTGEVVKVASVYGSPWYRRYW